MQPHDHSENVRTAIAALALAAIVHRGESSTSPQVIAALALSYADALIAELRKGRRHG